MNGDVLDHVPPSCKRVYRYQMIALSLLRQDEVPCRCNAILKQRARKGKGRH